MTSRSEFGNSMAVFTDYYTLSMHLDIFNTRIPDNRERATPPKVKECL